MDVDSDHPAVPELRRRFAFQPELSLLYDRQHGLEHRLNRTARLLVEHTFTSAAPARSLGQALAVPTEQAATQLKRFWAATTTAHTTAHPVRKSGAPSDWAQTGVPFPLVLEIELTKVCNWHCDFCYNVWKVPDSYGQRGRSTTGGDTSFHLGFDRVVAVLDEAADNGCLRIRLSGGEPTLHPDFAEIVAYAADKGFDIELFTNGSRLDDEQTAWLAARNVRVLLVSIHGLPDTQARLAANPRAYEHAIGGMQAGIKAGMRVLAECLVSEENLAEIPPLVDRLRDLGVQHVSFMPYVPYSPLDPRRPVALRAVQDLIAACSAQPGGDVDFRVPCAPRHCLTAEPTPIEEPVNEAFDNHCAAGILWASVSHDGRVRHCPHSSVYAGSVEEGIRSVWQERIVPTVRRALQPEGACGVCSQFDACQGGCHLNRVRSYETPDARPLLPLLSAAGRKG